MRQRAHFQGRLTFMDSAEHNNVYDTVKTGVFIRNYYKFKAKPPAHVHCRRSNAEGGQHAKLSSFAATTIVRSLLQHTAVILLLVTFYVALDMRHYWNTYSGSAVNTWRNTRGTTGSASDHVAASRP